MTARAESIVDAVDRLVTLPAVYFEIKRIIDSPDSDIITVAKAISTDVALTARLLHIVNSPVYAQGRPVETVTRAVSLLGMIQVHDLSLAVCLANAFNKIQPGAMDVARFWQDSQLRACTARKLGEHCGLRDRDRLYVLGLLADIGHMVLYMMLPDDMVHVLRERRQNKEADYLIERRLIGCDHAQTGGALLRRWSLPESIYLPIEQQTEPAPEQPFARQSALLNLVEAALQSHRNNGDIASLAHPAAWKIADITPEQVQEMFDECVAMLKSAPPVFQT
jgi:HD-like signal output (HDOD) protein